MNPNYHPPLFLTTALDPPSTYFLPVVYPEPPCNGGFNTDWDQTQQQVLLHIASQITGGHPSTVGATAAGTTSNRGHQCKWLTRGMLCGQYFSDFDALMEHLGGVHDVRGPASRRIVCQWGTIRGCCNNQYRRNAFRRHIRIHVGYSVRCTECGRPFSRTDSMRAHLRKQHEAM